MPLDQLLGPLGLTVALIAAVVYIGRAITKWVMDLWREHLRVDHERADALVKANDRVDSLRASNDGNMRIIERAVTQNERLVAALAQGAGGRHEGR